MRQATGKMIRSHRARVKEADRMVEECEDFQYERINIFDREAIVEYLLLEDILRLYRARLQREKKYVTRGRIDEKAQQKNIEKFIAIVDIMDALVGVTREAINAGEYKMVWSAIHEWPMMVAAKNVKNLPELRAMAVEILQILSEGMLAAVEASQGLNNDVDDLEAHEKNARRLKDLPPTMDRIEEVIHAAEVAIPDRTKKSKYDLN